MTKEEMLKDFSEKFTKETGNSVYLYGDPIKMVEWLSSVWDQLEQETAQKFDTFKVTEYPNYSDFKDTRQAYIAGQMHIMIEIKQLIDKFKAK